jgi:hypothetical protein
MSDMKWIERQLNFKTEAERADFIYMITDKPQYKGITKISAIDGQPVIGLMYFERDESEQV